MFLKAVSSSGRSAMAVGPKGLTFLVQWRAAGTGTNEQVLVLPGLAIHQALPIPAEATPEEKQALQDRNKLMVGKYASKAYPIYATMKVGDVTEVVPVTDSNGIHHLDPEVIKGQVTILALSETK